MQVTIFERKFHRVSQTLGICLKEISRSKSFRSGEDVKNTPNPLKVEKNVLTRLFDEQTFFKTQFNWYA